MLSKEEIKRYNRHLILSEIGPEGQQRLKQAKVLVVGAGGLGCPVLQYLTAAGVGTIGICDFDFVDESNLQRQILFGTDDVGKPKAKIAAQKLAALNPFIQFNIHNTMLTKENALELFADYDVIVDGSDNFPTRFLVNDACVIAGKPLVFGAIYKFEGQVAVFNYQNGPTYRCLVPEQPDSSEMLSCSQIGVMGVLPGIIGSYQANEAIKMITGTGELLSGKLLMIDTLRMEHNILTIQRNEATANIKSLGEYGDFCHDEYPDVLEITASDLFERMKNNEVKVFDIREPELFNSYHIESQRISIEELLEKPELLSGEKNIVLVCEKGMNSAAIIEELEDTERPNKVFNLQGGIQAWLTQDFPVINSEPKKKE
ncbi:MAG: molybdopterin-synthase adenylyltransferase MoeB [Chloroflexia bacterium]|nr:molybdopterin-synthase adenylyltransferase MoeB [Chloroflexia bacterium]